MGASFRAGKGERLQVRVNREQKELFQCAADLAGRSLTDFIVGSLQEAAEQAIRTHQVMELTARDTEILVVAILDPPSPKELLRAAARRHRDLLGEWHGRCNGPEGKL